MTTPRAAAEKFDRIAFAGAGARDNPLIMTSPAERPIWENHPLWHDRARLDAIRKQMWIEVQKTMFAGKPRRPLRNPGRTELTVVGGTSAEDAYSEAIHALLQYQPTEDADWEALGNTLAHRRAVAAVRRARKHRKLPDGSEITMASLAVENDDGAPLVDEIADDDHLPDERATERVLRAERLVALRTVADEILPQRDRDIVFRIARGETTVAIADIVNLTPQRVGQIHRESLRKINAQLRTDPAFRRLYEPEGGKPDG
jgi:DNA-directed RNA polymerase specialized sigma24 family protein